MLRETIENVTKRMTSQECDIQARVTLRVA
jgi:hypothetical protein